MNSIGRGSIWRLFALVAFVATAPAAEIPPTGEGIQLFDGTSLENFDTFVFGQGFNHDPEGVFRVADGTIRVEGMPYGYFITKQEYGDFYLRRGVQVGRGNAWTPPGQSAR